MASTLHHADRALRFGAVSARKIQIVRWSVGRRVQYPQPPGLTDMFRILPESSSPKRAVQLLGVLQLRLLTLLVLVTTKAITSIIVVCHLRYNLV